MSQVSGRRLSFRKASQDFETALRQKEENTKHSQSSVSFPKSDAALMSSERHGEEKMSLPRLNLPSRQRLGSSLDDSFLSRPRSRDEFGIVVQRGYSTERRPYSREVGALLQAERIYSKFQYQAKTATRLSGFRESIKSKPRPPRAPKKLPPMQTFALTDVPIESCDEDEVLESSENEETLDSVDETGSIVSLVNSQFQENWTKLSHRMMKSDASSEGHPHEEKDKEKFDTPRLFDKTFQETVQMLNGLKVNRNAQSMRIEDPNLPGTSEKPRKVNSKKVSSRRKVQGALKYLDVKEIKILINRQISMGLLDPKDAPILEDSIPMNNKIAELLLTLTSPLTAKINSRYERMFDSDEWSNLHRHDSSGRENTKDFISHNAMSVPSQNDREARVRLMALRHQERINSVLQHHNQIIEDYRIRMENLPKRRELMRQQKYYEEIVVPKQELWLTILTVVKFNRFILRYVMELRRQVLDFYQITNAAILIQRTYRYYREDKRMRIIVAKLKISMFLTRMIRKMKRAKIIHYVRIIRLFLADNLNCAKAKIVIHTYISKCIKIQRWWKSFIQTRNAQIELVSQQYTQGEMDFFRQLSSKDRQEMIRLSTERKRALALPTASMLAVPKQKYSGRRASSLSDTSTGNSSGMVPAPPPKQNATKLVPISESSAIDNPLETVTKEKTKKSLKKTMELFPASEGCLLDNDLKMEVISSDWRIRRKVYMREMAQYLLMADAYKSSRLYCDIYDFSTNPVSSKCVNVQEEPTRPGFSVVLSPKEMHELTTLAFYRLKSGASLSSVDESYDLWLWNSDLIPEQHPSDADDERVRKRRSKNSKKTS